MKKELYIILHNVRSRFNVGSVFRTADGAGVSKIYLGGITPAPPHSKIAKVSLGAENFVPYESVWHTYQLLDKLKKQGVRITAVEQVKNSIPYFKYKPKFPLAIIMGSETKGLSQAILKRCDDIIEIPMQGKKESLNVATACGVVAFQVSSLL
jgi:tRNA G18 (ribose-2'-O)-methylase SpoU